jgi:hypothetical protein
MHDGVQRAGALPAAQRRQTEHRVTQVARVHGADLALLDDEPRLVGVQLEQLLPHTATVLGVLARLAALCRRQNKLAASAGGGDGAAPALTSLNLCACTKVTHEGVARSDKVVTECWKG